MAPAAVKIDDDSCVAEVRRVAVAAARDEGLTEDAIGAVGLVATEAASNIRKHARIGEVHISRLSRFESPGVELLCLDRGPGMSDIESCLADGYSTAGTAGGGLGAIARHSAEFDVYSEPGKGTVVLARIRDARTAGAARAWSIGAISKPLEGEEACGDAWAVHYDGAGCKVILADGLGHGPFAADAAQTATSAFEGTPDLSPGVLVEAVHRALRGTRGAAVAIAALDGSGGLRYAGLGNISGIILGGQRPQYMLSHNGTAGHSASRVQEFKYALPASGFIVMHSDGLTTSWNLAAYPGLSRRHPAIIAATLYRDASRGRDDVCVVVVKEAPDGTS
jgi:anti-sigma regulatory factor (Ser/Thr protein kinase)